jgi:PAS domain S-box-containing protein
MIRRDKHRTTAAMNRAVHPDVYRLIVEQVADAIIYADTEGIVGAWNGAAERLFGYSKSEAIGQNLDLIIPTTLRVAHWKGFRLAMARGATQHDGRPTVTRAVTRSGEKIYVEMSFAVVLSPDGKPLGAVAIARDATKHNSDKQQTPDRLANIGIP